MICANQIPPTDGGAPASPQSYCCTNTETTCAYNPAAVCDPGTYAYECQNVNRPESYNPAIRCGQGVRGTKYVDYCCSGTGLPSGCGEQDGLAGCVPGLVGWQCPITGTQHTLPKGQDLMANKSRADQYYLLCSIPQVAPSGKVDTFCCYPPAAVPPGGSCLEDVYVSNCNPLTQFGFACTGTDTPADDYPPIVCPEPRHTRYQHGGLSCDPLLLQLRQRHSVASTDVDQLVSTSWRRRSGSIYGDRRSRYSSGASTKPQARSWRTQVPRLSRVTRTSSIGIRSGTALPRRSLSTIVSTPTSPQR